MAIQGIGGGSLTMSFRQNNVSVDRMGEQATAVRMRESHPNISNTGSETNVGTSEFSKGNDEVIEISVDKISEIMERDDELTAGSNLGESSPYSSSGFSEANNVSVDKQQQIAVAARAYSYFNE